MAQCLSCKTVGFSMQVLILGHQADAHAAHIYQALKQVGVNVNYWDTRLFPTQLQLSWQPHNQIGQLHLPDGQQIDLQTIHSVFWRSLSETYVPPLQDEALQHIALNDVASLLRSLIQACPAHWVNSWKAYQFHREKPLQLATVGQLGVKIPATLISNDPEQVMAFVASHPDVIFKPVYGGAHTQRVTQRHLDADRLQAVLRLAPVTIQDYVEGTNIRCYVIGNRVYSAEIRSTAIDFRTDSSAQVIPMQLPESIQSQCREIARSLYLEWTAIDWRMTPAGEFMFLEANPSPMFLHFEHETKSPITKSLVELLTAE